MKEINSLIKAINMITVILVIPIIILLSIGLILTIGNMADRKLNRVEKIIKAIRGTNQGP